MKKCLIPVVLVSFGFAFLFASAGVCSTTAAISAPQYKAGDTVTIEGTIDPGKDLYIAVSSQNTFAPEDTKGVHETKHLNAAAKKNGFTRETSIPDLYYMLTSNPEEFGTITKKKYGGPSFFTEKGKRGLYEEYLAYQRATIFFHFRSR